MARKTVDVAGLRKQANLMLGLKGDEYTIEYRKAVIGLIEHVLQATGNYKGFQYRYSEWDVERSRLREDYDDTRRTYH